MKDDGTLEVDGKPSPLQRVLLARRSYRKYARGEASEAQVRSILEAVDSFTAKAGFLAARIEILGPGPDLDAVVKGAMKGVVGKINPWLPFTNARHMILCGAIYPEGEDKRGIEIALAQASMAMPVAVLAAAELGLGTCWLAGIHHRKVEEAYRMKDGARLVAISPLGLPPTRMGMSWDAMVVHLTSKRRKPLEEIWMKERWREGRGS